MTATGKKQVAAKKQPYWLVYVSLFLSGLLLLADTYRFLHLHLWTARLGIALLYSAFSLFVGNGRTTGFLAAAVIWLAVVATVFI